MKSRKSAWSLLVPVVSVRGVRVKTLALLRALQVQWYRGSGAQLSLRETFDFNFRAHYRGQDS